MVSSVSDPIFVTTLCFDMDSGLVQEKTKTFYFIAHSLSSICQQMHLKCAQWWKQTQTETVTFVKLCAIWKLFGKWRKNIFSYRKRKKKSCHSWKIAYAWRSNRWKKKKYVFTWKTKLILHWHEFPISII